MRGPDRRTGELAPDRVSGATFEALGQNRNRHCGRVRHEQVRVVGLAVQLRQLDIDAGATVRMVPQKVIMASVFGYEHQWGVWQRHIVPVAAVGRGCQCPSLRLCRG